MRFFVIFVMICFNLMKEKDGKEEKEKNYKK